MNTPEITVDDLKTVTTALNHYYTTLSDNPDGHATTRAHVADLTMRVMALVAETDPSLTPKSGF